ncbi:hypothetical protein ACODT3_41600 [Streptomyces sp. 4.24]|uniref:hypothetical protein n=1 Tax=Streptomyces tritrimontium TaxID=3406573 RepID=UPI003BB74769
MRTDLTGPKSGFTGRVWAWVPKQYGKPEYKDSAFPVLMALPGAVGYPTNYFFSKEFRLQERIGEAADKGESLPFIVVMPVLNANKDTYYDGSDIPGQPKMGLGSRPEWLPSDGSYHCTYAANPDRHEAALGPGRRRERAPGPARARRGLPDYHRRLRARPVATKLCWQAPVDQFRHPPHRRDSSPS